MYLMFPPVLLSPSPYIESREPCTWKNIVYPALSALPGIGAIALQALGYGSNSLWNTSLSFTAGAAVQFGLQTALRHEWANQEKSLIGDYATPIFLIATQVYANTTPSPLVQEIVLSSLVAFSGAATAAIVHTLFTRNLADGRESQPLITLENRDSSMKGVGISTPQRRLFWSAFEITIGAGVIAAGAQISQLALLRDFGAISVGDGIGQLASELAHRHVIHSLSKNPSLDNGIFLDSKTTTIIRRYDKLAKIALTGAHILPGACIVVAGSWKKSVLASDFFYGLAGLSTGIKRHMERARFFTSPSHKLTELHRPKKPLKPYEKVFRVMKWGIAAMTAAYLTLGIIGFDFANGQLDQFAEISTIDLSTFFLSLFGSYAISEIAKRMFHKEQTENAWKNEIYFYTRYSLGAPIIALYLLEKMKIGDKALLHYKLVADVLSAIAYTSLGIAIGQEASVRGEFNHPRLPSALFTALSGKFLARKALGEIH